MNAGIIGYEVGKRAPYAQPSMTAAQRNVRPKVIVAPQESPEGPRDGNIPSRPARIPIITFQSVASIKAVMNDEFGPDVAQAPVHTADVTTARGGLKGERMGPWYERANIRRQPSVAFGSLFAMDNDTKYEILMGKGA